MQYMLSATLFASAAALTFCNGIVMISLKMVVLLFVAWVDLCIFMYLYMRIVGEVAGSRMG